MKIIYLLTISLFLYGCSEAKVEKLKPLYSKIKITGEKSEIVKNVDVKEIALEAPIRELLKNENIIKIEFSKDQPFKDGVLTESHTYYITFENDFYTLLKGDARVEKGKKLRPLVYRLKKEEKIEL